MRLRVLGCSGGIGGREVRTTAFLIDEDTLIDCGTGVGDLAYDELLRIDRVFISHSHLDHIALLPLLVDTVAEVRRAPLTVFALPETIRILRSHIFNWLVWPDFSAIPDRHSPYLRFQPIGVGESAVLSGGRKITALPAHHTVPAAAFCLDSGSAKLVYSGDTAYCRELIEAINGLKDLRYFIIESAFSDSQHALALAARHLCPVLLTRFLDEITVNPKILITHLKPGLGERIMSELHSYRGRIECQQLQHGKVIEF